MIKMQRITDRETIGGEYLTIVPTPATEHAIASATPGDREPSYMQAGTSTCGPTRSAPAPRTTSGSASPTGSRAASMPMRWRGPSRGGCAGTASCAGGSPGTSSVRRGGHGST